ncbi:MAG TPA: MarR family transcriptional regulator [Actinospica sp.]|nr:MarR family transcriptional regulator [Actinospica sp.]
MNPESTGPGPAAERTPSHADPASVDPQEIARLRVAIGRLHRRMVQSTSGDLTFSQTSALVAVEQLGPIRLGELAARERVAAPSMTRTVSGLVEAGLLNRAGDPLDGRSFLLSITDRGRHFLEEMRTERNAALAQSISHLSESEFDVLRAALPVLEHLAQQKS